MGKKEKKKKEGEEGRGVYMKVHLYSVEHVCDVCTG